MTKPWIDEETGKIFCTVNDWSCPYCKKDGSCSCENVEDNCDDFYSFWSEEIDEWHQNKFNEDLLLEKQIMED